MAETEDLKIQIRVSNKEAQEAINKVANEFNELQDATGKAQSAIRQFGKKIESSFSKVQASVISVNQAFELLSKASQVTGQAFERVLGSANELEKQVAEINTLITDGSAANVNFAQSILDVQKRFGGNQAAIAKSFYDALSSGAVDATNATELLDKTAQLAIGGITDLGTATSLTTGILNAYQLDVSQTSRITDTLFATVQKGVTTIPELSDQFGVVASVAAPAGVALEEVGAALAAVTASGVNTNRAATAIRASIVALQKPTESLKEIYEELGIASISATLEQDGLGRTLQRVSQAVGNNSEELINLIGSTEALPAVTALATQGAENFNKTLNEVKESALSAGEVTSTASNKIANTITFQAGKAFDNLNASLTELGVAIKVAFGPLFVSATQSLTEASKAITSFAEGLSEIDFERVTKSAIEFSAILGGIIALTKTQAIAVFAATQLTALVAAFKAATAAALAFQASTAVFIAALVAVAGAVDLLINNLGKLDKLYAFLVDGTIAFVSVLASELGNLFGGIAEFFGLEDISAEFKNAASEIDLAAEQAFLSSQKAGQELNDSFTKDILKTTGVIGEATDEVSFEFKKVNREVKKLTNETASETGSAASQSIEKLKSDSQDAIQELKRVFGQAQSQKFELSLAGQSELEVIDARLAKELEAIDALEERIAKADRLNDKTQSQLNLVRQVAEQQAQASRIDVNLINPETEQQLNAIREANESFFNEQKLASMSQLDAIEEQKNAELERLSLLDEELEKLKERAQILGDTQELSRIEAAQSSIGRAQSRVSAQATTRRGQVQDEAAGGLANSLSGLGLNIGNEISGAITNVIGTEIVTAISEAANIIALVLKAPELINALTGLIEQILNFPRLLQEAVAGLVGALTDFITDFVSNLGTFLPRLIDDLLTLILDVIPKLPGVLVEAAFEIIEVQIKNAPRIISSLITNLITQLPKVVVGIIRAIVASIPAIVQAIAETIPQLIPTLINTFKEVLADLAGTISDIFSGAAFEPEAITDGFSNVQSEIQNATDNTFAVLEEQVGGRGIDLSDRISKAIDGSTNRAASVLQFVFGILETLWETIKTSWMIFLITPLETTFKIAETIFRTAIEGYRVVFKLLGTIGEAAAQLFKGVFEGAGQILSGVADAFGIVWDGIVLVVETTILKPLQAIWDFATTVFTDPIAAFENLFSDIGSIFSEFGKGLGELLDRAVGVFSTITEGLETIVKSLFGFVESVGGALADAGRALWDVTKDLFSGIGNILANAFKKSFEAIDGLVGGLGTKIFEAIRDAFKNASGFFKELFKIDFKGKGAVERFIGLDFPWANFAEGGRVPGRSVFGGDDERNDTVPALLSPGEFVIPRSAMQDPTVQNFVEALEKGKPLQMFGLGGFVKAVADAGGDVLRGDDPGKNLSKAKEEIKEVNPFDLLSNTVKSVIDFVNNIGGNVNIAQAVTDPLNAIKDAFQPVAGEFFKPFVTSAIGLQSGGVVPGSGSGDIVPAMLEPGEFVLNRRSVSSLGLNTLNDLNRGAQSSGDTSIVVNLDIQTTQPIDEAFVKRRIVPTVKDELRKDSIDGRRILNPRGVRR